MEDVDQRAYGEDVSPEELGVLVAEHQRALGRDGRGVVAKYELSFTRSPGTDILRASNTTARPHRLMTQATRRLTMAGDRSK